MFKVVKKKILNSNVSMMEISAKMIADKAKPGQFLMLRVDQDGERIPLTIADCNRKCGTVSIIFQIVGSTTTRLNRLNEGDHIKDLVGPLGKASELDDLKKVALIGGGVGCAIAYPVAKYLHSNNAIVHSIVGFRNKNLVILQDEFEKISNRLIIMTDDGSFGNKGLVTDALENLINSGEKYDKVIAIGPLVMMKFVSRLTQKHNIKTTVSMNPIMIDGTGMCGGCRVRVGNEVKFACVDGPDFDGHLVDFDEAISRSTMYRDFERESSEKTCNLFKRSQKECQI